MKYCRTLQGYMEELNRIYPAQILREGKRWKLAGISYTAGKPCGLYRDSAGNYRAFDTRKKKGDHHGERD